ncbi:MAG: MerC domain-containing protein, partial [Bacteroidota bacterium]
NRRMILDRALPESDIVGAAASTLCVIHCMATPLLFVVQSSTVTDCASIGPGWWNAIDYLFIGITFFAVYYSVKTTSQQWMKYALYGSWVVLTILIFNEKFHLLPLAEMWKYGAAFTLVGFHLYNRKYCQCADEECCTT